MLLLIYSQKKLETKHVVDLINYKETYIQSDDIDRNNQFNVLLNMLYDKKPKIMNNIIKQISEAKIMSQEQMCRTLFPEFVAAKDAAVKNWKKDCQEDMLNDLLQGLRDTASQTGLPVEVLIQNFKIPEWCSREEALRRIRAM